MLSRRAMIAGAGLATLAAAPERRIRVGALQFGSFAWELAVIRDRGLAPGLAIDLVPLASTPASQVALLGGRVDVVVQDWLWVSRQRAVGTPLSLSPTSGALGAVIVPAGSQARSLADLAGLRLGVAGSPLDKSFLILRAYAQRAMNFDLAQRTDLQFGAPPLLSAALDAGRLDAVLTYWPFAARAEASGRRSLLAIEAAVQALGIAPGLPFIGYVFAEGWAHEQAPALAAFLAAGRRARDILRHDDAAWTALRPVMAAASDAEFLRLRAWYRSGVSGAMTPARLADAARLYDVLAAIGGAALVGPAPHLTPGTFWTA